MELARFALSTLAVEGTSAFLPVELLGPSHSRADPCEVLHWVTLLVLLGRCGGLSKRGTEACRSDGFIRKWQVDAEGVDERTSFGLLNCTMYTICSAADIPYANEYENIGLRLCNAIVSLTASKAA